MKKLFAVLLLILCVPMMCSCAGASDCGGIITNGVSAVNGSENKLFDKVCSADEALKLSKESATVVFEGMKCTSGEEVWNAFYNRTRQGKPASVLCADYYTLDREHVSEELYEEEKDQYPKLFFELVEYDGHKYTVTSRECTAAEPESAETYKYLAHYTGKPSSPYALYSTYDYYVLVDDPDVTWERIEEGMFSSQSGMWIRHRTVYSNTFE